MAAATGFTTASGRPISSVRSQPSAAASMNDTKWGDISNVKPSAAANNVSFDTSFDMKTPGPTAGPPSLMRRTSLLTMRDTLDAAPRDRVPIGSLERKGSVTNHNDAPPVRSLMSRSSHRPDDASSPQPTSPSNASFARFPHTPGVAAGASSPSRQSSSTSLVELNSNTSTNNTNNYTTGGHDPQYFGRPRTHEVTVFGFPVSKASMVINHFASFGEITRRVDGVGNWTHLTYKNRLHAEMALTQNGRILDGEIMIGVRIRAHILDDREPVPESRPALAPLPRSSIFNQDGRDVTCSTLPSVSSLTDYSSTGRAADFPKRSFMSNVREFIFNW